MNAGGGLSMSVYYVRPDGKDTINYMGSKERPFRTISYAAEVMKPGDVCYIGGGVYRETVRPARSGEEGAPIVFRALPGERVVVEGCDPVKGFEKWKGDIWRAPAPDSLGLGRDFVTINGEALVQARYPNFHEKGREYDVPVSPFYPTRGQMRTIRGEYAVVSPLLEGFAENYWKGALYCGLHEWHWTMQSGVVESSVSGRLNIGGKRNRPWYNVEIDFYDLFRECQSGFLTNHLGCMTYPGCWHLEDGYLYVWMPDGSDPNGAEIGLKRRQLGFDLTERDWIRVEDIDLHVCSATLYKANWCVFDRCRMTYISHAQFVEVPVAGYISEKEDLARRGEFGLYFGGTHNDLLNSTIAHSAGAGVFLAGAYSTVRNNVIHDCAYSGTYAGNVNMRPEIGSDFDGPRGGHTITHNTLYNAGRSVINISQGDVPGEPCEGFWHRTPYLASEIAYNRVYNAGLCSQDGGNFYCYQVNLNDTRIHHNLFYDNWTEYWGSLIFYDGVVANVYADHNVLWQSPHEVLFSQEPAVQAQLLEKRHPPTNNNTRFFANAKRPLFCTGGIEALTLKDYPDGVFFESGADHDDELNPVPPQKLADA